MTLSFGRGTPMYMAPEMLRSRADHHLTSTPSGSSSSKRSPDGSRTGPTSTAGSCCGMDEPPEFPEGFPAARPAVEGCLRLDPDDRFQTVAEPSTSSVRRHVPATRWSSPRSHERVRAVADAEAAPRPSAERPSASSGSSAGILAGLHRPGRTGREPAEIDPGSPAGRARMLVRELRTKAEAAAAKDGPRPASVSVIPVPPKMTGAGLTMLETIRVGLTSSSR